MTNSENLKAVLMAPKTAPAESEDLAGRELLSELRDGIAYAARSVEVRFVLILITAATLSYSGLFAIGYAFQAIAHRTEERALEFDTARRLETISASSRRR